MTQQPYYRNIWACGPSSNGYPGAFPRGLIRMIKARWWGTKRLWLFSGSYKDPSGTTVDIKKEVNPNVVANCESLPFKDASFNFVMLDPPYSVEEARRLYGTKYPGMVKVMNEAARVAAPGGYVLLLHRLIPCNHPSMSSEFRKLKVAGIVGVITIAGFTNIRALTVWRKEGSLEAFR